MYRRIVVLAILSLSLVTAAAGIASAAAQDPGTKRIGLVVALPESGELLEIVTVPATATTLEVLRASKVTMATQDSAFGTAICSINGVGCPATDCFCDPAHFWAYYHLDPAAGTWVAASEGVGSYVPADGSVEGLAWSGFDANYNPTVQPPVRTFAQILAATAPAPVPIPEPATLLLVGAGLAGLGTYLRRARAR